MPVCVINNAKWQVRAFRFCHDANSSLHTFSDTTSYIDKWAILGGEDFLDKEDDIQCFMWFLVGERIATTRILRRFACFFDLRACGRHTQ